MPPRSPASRRRTVARRTANVSSIGFWVTDAMLLQAVEQYHRAIAASCRRISSHSGPLESRRRTARRHMTGLIPTSHAYPPIWQFDVGPSTMHWEGPTTQEYRRQKQKRLSVSGLLSSFTDWLGTTGPAISASILPPEALSTKANVSMEALALSPETEPETISDPILQETMSSHHVPEEIVRLRTSICSMEAINLELLLQVTKTCRRSLRRRVEQRELTVEALLASLEPLDRISKCRIPSIDVTNKISAMIRRTVLYAMIDAQKRTSEAVPSALWVAFVARLCASNGDNHDIQLFWRLMDAIPAAAKSQIRADLMHNLCTTFVTAQANRHNLFAHWSARAARFSQALQNLDSQQKGEVDESMNSFLLHHASNSESAWRTRFSWLVIKSYDADMDAKSFAHVYRTYISQGPGANSMQLWQLLVGRLCSIGALHAELRNKIMDAKYANMGQRWASLIRAVMASSEQVAGLQELYSVLADMGEFNPVIRALTHQSVYPLRRDIIQAVASASTNYKHTLQLHDAVHLQYRIKRSQPPPLHWSVWASHVEDMIKDPSLDPSRIWQVLQITRTSQRAIQDTRQAAEERIAKSHLLDRMGQWFVESKHLNDRQALRNVQRCATAQRALTDAVSSQTLANLAGIITRDLENGQRGRTSRMQWLLRMIAQNQGPEQAKAVASALKGWRWNIEPTRNGPL